MNRRIDEIKVRLERESNPDKSTDEKLEDGSSMDWISNSENDVAWLLDRLNEFIAASRQVLGGIQTQQGMDGLRSAIQRATEDTADRSASADYHAHLTVCIRCANEPFRPCPVGANLLRYAVDVSDRV